MSGEQQTPDVNAIVTHEQDGRVLSGVGADAEKLAETMERHAPPEPQPAKGTPVAPTDGKSAETSAAQGPPQTRGQKRFSELTAEREAARAEAAAAKAEREQIARERDELKARVEAASRPAEPQTPAEPAKPKKFPTYDEFIAIPGNESADWYAYDDAKADWRAQQRAEQEGQTIEQRVASILEQRDRDRAFQTTVQASQERGRKAYADFDTLLKGPAGKVPLGRDPENDRVRLAFIAGHPQSEHIQYAILKDAELAKRLSQASDVEFGVLVAGLVPPPAPAKPAWTPPPPPHPTVGASSPTASASSSEAAKKGDFDAYRSQRAAERNVRPRF